MAKLGSQAESLKDSSLKFIKVQFQKSLREGSSIFSMIPNLYSVFLSVVVKSLFNEEGMFPYPKIQHFMPIGTLQPLQNTVKRPERLLHTSQVLWSVGGKLMLEMNYES